MKKSEYKEFMKRYDKFKNNNLPTPFWDEERQTLEFVNIGNRKTIFNFGEADNKMEIYNNLTEALENIADTSFYYSYTTKYQKLTNEGIKFVVGKTHAHSFENVVRDIYQSPESFRISHDEEEFFSKQELRYLKKLQKYLLFIGLKDINSNKITVTRYRNKLHEKYKNAHIIYLDDNILNNILNDKINFLIFKCYDIYEPKTYTKGEYQELITDKDYNFKLFIEYTYDEIKLYKDIKDIYHVDNLNDCDKVIVRYFKILDKFN